jgi:hypothetical protein
MTSSLLQSYRTEGFLRVEGWGIDQELIDLFEMFNDFQRAHGLGGPMCEIGVHHGRTLILLGLLKRPQEKVIGIDLFESNQSQNLDASGSGSIAAVHRNLAEFAPGIEIDLISANSFDLSVDQRNCLQGCRLFHIDGGHFIEVVLNDIALAQSTLGVGGIIVIDDYWHSGFPEVQEAVHRYFWTSAAMKAVPFMAGKNKLFLAHNSHKERLLDFVAAKLPANRRKPIRLLGYNAICCDPH